MRWAVVIEKAGSNYGAYVPDLPGCVATGVTNGETQREIREAIAFHGRLKGMRRTIRRLLCIFPFEEEFFTRAGIETAYIGHPLAGLVRPALSKDEFFRKHRLAAGRPSISVLPGSRRGEAVRHLPALLDAAERLYREAEADFQALVANLAPLRQTGELDASRLFEANLISGVVFDDI